jgi:hypothetical protein
MIFVSAVGLCVRGHRHGPPCVMRPAALLHWAGPVVVGHSRPLPRCPPHVAHVGANSTSRPCSGPALLLASRPPAHARHSLTAAHILVCPLCTHRPTASAPGSQSGGDPSVDSFLSPSATMAAGPRGSVVAWWSHLGPIRLVHRFCRPVPCHPSPPRLTLHATELQFGVCSAPGH